MGCGETPTIARDATLDPQVFVDTYHRLNPSGTALVLQPATAVMVDATGWQARDAPRVLLSWGSHAYGSIPSVSRPEAGITRPTP